MSESEFAGFSASEHSVRESGGQASRAQQKRTHHTTKNPRGYPPFEVDKVVGYTNRQLLYYTKTASIPDQSLTAFHEAIARRNQLKVATHWDGNTDDDADGEDNGKEDD